jgi:Glycosyl transferase family 2
MAATGKIATAGSVRERKLISVIVPVLNEENNIARAHAEVCKVFDAMGCYDLEIIFTDNHSITARQKFCLTSPASTRA